MAVYSVVLKITVGSGGPRWLRVRSFKNNRNVWHPRELHSNQAEFRYTETRDDRVEAMIKLEDVWPTSQTAPTNAAHRSALGWCVRLLSQIRKATRSFAAT